MVLSEADAQRIADAVQGQDFTVISMESKPYRRRPVPPFTTSTLQAGCRQPPRDVIAQHYAGCTGAV